MVLSWLTSTRPPSPYDASISPYGDPPGTSGADEDYYQLTAAAGTTLNVIVGAFDSARLLTSSALDPVVEIVDANGQRYTTCNDPYDDNPPASVPITKDPTPSGFDDPCMNHGGDANDIGPTRYAKIDFEVPGTSENVTFYIHIFDFRGDARPDLFYTLVVQ